MGELYPAAYASLIPVLMSSTRSMPRTCELSEPMARPAVGLSCPTVWYDVLSYQEV
jgi:hypothetical protein